MYKMSDRPAFLDSASPNQSAPISQIICFPQESSVDPSMGFPVGYSELPRILFHLLFLLVHLRKLINCVFRCLGLGDSEAPWHDADIHQHSLFSLAPVPADLIQACSPATRFDRLAGDSVPGSCAVCLYEFDSADEVRRMSNCRHVFHRRCVDRWLEHGQRTCPLCRAPLVPDEPRADGEEHLYSFLRPLHLPSS